MVGKVEKVYTRFQLFKLFQPIQGGSTMNIDTATKEIRLKSWADIIKDRNESGLTIDEYCNIHNLSRNSYYHYLRELKKEAVQSPEFIELGASGHTCRNVPFMVGQEADNDFRTELLIKRGNVDVCINSTTPAVLLAKVMKVLRYAE